MHSVAWAVGIYEGEGCTCIHRDKDGKVKQVTLSVGSTDLDVLLKLQEIWGCGHVRPHKYGPSRVRRKPAYVWRISKKADVKRVLEKMLPHLFERRAEKAREALFVLG
jgi:hypothetical protein